MKNVNRKRMADWALKHKAALAVGGILCGIALFLVIYGLNREDYGGKEADRGNTLSDWEIRESLAHADDGETNTDPDGDNPEEVVTAGIETLNPEILTSYVEYWQEDGDEAGELATGQWESRLVYEEDGTTSYERPSRENSGGEEDMGNGGEDRGNSENAGFGDVEDDKISESTNDEGSIISESTNGEGSIISESTNGEEIIIPESSNDEESIISESTKSEESRKDEFQSTESDRDPAIQDTETGDYGTEQAADDQTEAATDSKNPIKENPLANLTAFIKEGYKMVDCTEPTQESEAVYTAEYDNGIYDVLVCGEGYVYCGVDLSGGVYILARHDTARKVSDVVIPSEIGGFPVVALDNLYQDLDTIRSIYIPASVRFMDLTFSGCTGVEKVTIETGSQLESLGKSGQDALAVCKDLNGMYDEDGRNVCIGTLICCDQSTKRRLKALSDWFDFYNTEWST